MVLDSLFFSVRDNGFIFVVNSKGVKGGGGRSKIFLSVSRHGGRIFANKGGCSVRDNAFLKTVFLSNGNWIT